MIVAVVVEALHGGLLDPATHPLDLALGPGVVGLGHRYLIPPRHGSLNRWRNPPSTPVSGSFELDDPDVTLQALSATFGFTVRGLGTPLVAVGP